MVERPQIALADELRRRSGFPIACFGHAGDGNIHVNIMAAGYKEDAAVRGKVQIILDELFAKVLEWGGASTGEHGVGIAKQHWWPQAVSETSHQVHEALQRALDPAGLLNPNKFVTISDTR